MHLSKPSLGLAVAAVFLAAASGWSSDYTWTNSGGGHYGTDGNWSPAGWPSQADDNALFDLSAAYTVLFPDGILNRTIEIRDDTLVFDLQTHTARVSQLTTGYTAGDVSSLLITNGHLIVTNDIMVGYNGAAHLTVAADSTLVISNFLASYYCLNGNNPAATSTVTVAGSNALLVMNKAFRWGTFWTGQTPKPADIRVRDGGTFIAAGSSEMRWGALEVSGANSWYDNTGLTFGAKYGTCSIVISNGGKLTCYTPCLSSSGSTVDVAVVGTGSVFESGIANLIPYTTDGSVARLSIRNGGRMKSTGTTTSFYVRENGSVFLEDGRIEGAPGWHSNEKYRHYWNQSLTRGTGCIQTGSLENDGGRLEPGAPIGCLEVDGVLNLHDSGTLAVEIGGRTPKTDYDVVDVINGGGYKAGEAWLGGTVAVSFVNGFLPQNGDAFDILTAVTITNTSLDGVTFDLPSARGVTWETAIVSTAGGEALRLTALMLPASGTLLIVR